MVDSSGPFTPYRVLDLTDACGQLAARLLADLGADVIKVEPPDGSLARREGPYYHDDPRPDRSLSWFFYNANKRGITLSLDGSEGRSLLRRLAERADVLFESFPPGHLAALGLDYEALSAVNPRLVMVSITPFGSTGPYAHYKTSDLVAQAMGGRIYLDGDDDRPPVRMSAPQAYSHAGMQAAAGAAFALYERGASGLGQHVDISVQESVAWTLMNATHIWDISHVNVKRGGAVRTTTNSGLRPLNHRAIWPCRDGYVFFQVAGGLRGGVSRPALVSWMEEEGIAGYLAEYDWTSYSMEAIEQEQYDRIEEGYARFFATKTRAELFDHAIRESYMLAPVENVAEIAASTQLAARDYWQSLHHDDLAADLTYPGPGVKGTSGWTLRRPAPQLGEHNAEVYGELGLDAADLRTLMESGVI